MCLAYRRLHEPQAPPPAGLALVFAPRRASSRRSRSISGTDRGRRRAVATATPGASTSPGSPASRRHRPGGSLPQLSSASQRPEGGRWAVSLLLAARGALRGDALVVDVCDRTIAATLSSARDARLSPVGRAAARRASASIRRGASRLRRGSRSASPAAARTRFFRELGRTRPVERRGCVVVGSDAEWDSEATTEDRPPPAAGRACCAVRACEPRTMSCLNTGLTGTSVLRRPRRGAPALVRRRPLAGNALADVLFGDATGGALPTAACPGASRHPASR